MGIFEGDQQQIGSAIGLIIMLLYLGFHLLRKK